MGVNQCVIVLRFKNGAKSYIVRILLFGRWRGKASHDRCVSKGVEVKELYLYSTASS